MAPVHAKFILQLLLPGFTVRVPRIGNPPIRLHQRRRSQILILVPPVGRARRRAASTQDTLVETIQLLPIFLRLEELAFLWGIVVLQVRLDRLVLLVKVRQVWYQVLDDVHMRQWVDLAVLRGISINPAQARKRILPIDVHRTGPAYTLPA